MPVWELSALTWEEARDLAGERAVAVLPVGAVEAHGPHLPLATDVVIAEAMARAGAERLAARGYDVILLPSLAYSAAPFAAAFPGTISIRPETMTTLVTDIARALAAHRVRALAIANAHLDPAHLASLHEAADRTPVARSQLELTIVFPDLTRKPWALRLTEEFRSGACHAGRFESSIVMAERPAWVRDAVRSGLPEVPHSLSVAIREGKRTFEEAGGPRAYFGDPAAASVEEGRETIAVLGEILEEAVLEALEVDGLPDGRGTTEPGGKAPERPSDRATQGPAPGAAP